MDAYYDDGSCVIYHGDCREVLPTLAADAVVTDPPYGIADAPLHKKGGKRSGKVRANDWHPPSDWDHVLDPAWGPMVCATASIVAWFGHWRRRPEVEAFMPWPVRAEIVWAKDCHVGPPAPLAPRDERIWLFAETALIGRRFETSVWDEPIIPTWERKHHKNEKPVALLRRLLAWVPADRIVDPFMGSGTTLRAAKDLGLCAVGIERNERYCEVAALRLGQAVLPLGDLAPSASNVAQEAVL